MKHRTQLDPASPRSTFPVEYMTQRLADAMNERTATVSSYIDHAASEYRRACDLSDPTCKLLAVRSLRKEASKAGMPIPYRAARAILS